MGKKSIHQELEEAVREKEEPAEAADKQSGKARKERRDKGKKLIKQRDLVVLLWTAQQYAARLDHVQDLLSRMPGRGGKQVSPTGLTLSAVLQVVDRWVVLGLLQLAYARHTPAESTLPHLHHINRVRLDMERRHPDFRWISERTLRASQPRREEGSVLPHLPDARVCTPKLVAVEVERSPKSDKELDDILTELLITGGSSPNDGDPLLYTTVWYFVRPETRTSVEKARDRLPPDCQPRVKVLSLETLTEFQPEEV